MTPSTNPTALCVWGHSAGANSGGWSNTIGNHCRVEPGRRRAKWGHTLPKPKGAKATDGENVVNFCTVQPQIHLLRATYGRTIDHPQERSQGADKWRHTLQKARHQEVWTSPLLCPISTSPPKVSMGPYSLARVLQGGLWTLGVPQWLHCERGSEKHPMPIVWFAILASHGWPKRRGGSCVWGDLLAGQLVPVLGSDQLLRPEDTSDKTKKHLSSRISLILQ